MHILLWFQQLSSQQKLFSGRNSSALGSNDGELEERLVSLQTEVSALTKKVRGKKR